MRHFAIVGSGPAGFYTAEALEKAYGDQARIDIIDRFPVPYGLIRFGVRPTTSRSRRSAALRQGRRERRRRFRRQCHRRPRHLHRRAARPLRRRDPRDRRAARPQARHSRRRSARRRRSAEFVGWYNGHPDFADLDPPLGGTHAAVDRRRQCRARLRAHPVQDARRVRRSDIVGHALDVLDAVGDPTVTILGRRGPHQIAMTPRSSASSATSKPPCRSSTRPTSRRVEADEALEPGLRKSVTLLRGFADLASQQGQADRLRLLRQAGRDRRRRQGRADRRRADRCSTTRARRAAPARPTGAGIAGRQRDRLSTLADRRRALRSAAASSSTTAAASPTGCTRSAGHGADRPARSAPTAPTAMKSPSRSPRRCRREARRPARAPGSSACSTRGVMPTDYDDWRKIEETETAARARLAAREIRPRRGLAARRSGR